MSEAARFAGHGLSLTIDLSAIVANWQALAAVARPAECAAVVKADAYGCGAATVGPALASAGCRSFFVALPHEGVALREALDRAGHEAAVYILNGFFPEVSGDYAAFRLRPVLGSMAEIAAWANAGAPSPAALHIDTGMNRLGLRLAEVRGLVGSTDLPWTRLSLVMSHFACADEPDHPLNGAQIRRFEEVAALFPGVPRSLANSAGIFLGPAARHDLARPGIALYGGASHPDAAGVIRPTVEARARILTIRQAKAGESVGYGAAATLRRDSRIAILSAGYADGFLRAGGVSDVRPGGHVAIAGRRAPILGRVSMDLTAVDVTEFPDQAIEGARDAELFGRVISVDEAAAAAGTIAYEFLTGLSRRAHRAYLPA